MQGNRLVAVPGGQPIRLRGVNRSGTEYACVQGWGIFDGPADSASVAAMAAWNINVVRVPLNESCWLAIAGVKPEVSGAIYQRAIVDYVGRLNRAGMVAVLELHWTGNGTTSQTGQAPMPNRAHTPEFWRQVATAFKGNDAVVLDLFNEPFPDSNRDSPEAWRCWRDGGRCAGMAEEAAGMQELVTAVRATGATNVIALGGVRYANALSGWLAHRPVDPLDNVVAAWHVYDFNACNSRSCWDAEAAPVARQVPLLLGEIGHEGRSGDRAGFVTALMDWMDANGVGYLPWTWNTWDGSPWRLIQSHDGTPTAYGAIYKARFQR